MGRCENRASARVRDARDARDTRDAGNACDAGNAHAAHRPALPGAFQLLYQSRDGRLCLFESKEGHLSAIDAAKLA